MIKVKTDDGLVELMPLAGKSDCFDTEVRKLQRPYIVIQQDDYEKILSLQWDYFKYKDKVVTFGTADGGYALMPLQEKYAQKIIDKTLEIMRSW